MCLSVCTPDPQKVKGIIENVCFKAQNFMIFVKNSKGGSEVNGQRDQQYAKQAGAELCQAQLKLCLGLFCFRLNNNSSS